MQNRKVIHQNEKLLIKFKLELLNHIQRVVINGVKSNWGEINSCVPQGSFLGPLLLKYCVLSLSNP